MTEYGPHSGESQSLLGLSSLSLCTAAWQPEGFDKSKSSFVHLSAFRPAPWALVVSCEVGEQKTSTKSMRLSLLRTNIAMSVLSSLCHFRFL